MSVDNANTLDLLSQHLAIPGASLVQSTVPDTELRLWLMSLENPQVEMSFGEIEALWQQLPFWAFAWAGGNALVRWIMANPQAVKGKRVLDFGCGSGLVGVAAALCGAREVWCADLDGHALLAAQLNAELNNVDIHCVDGDWPDVDLLLAADVLYDISSSGDLRQLMLTIPQWLLAETRYVAPDFVALTCLHSETSCTIPAIGDFDESVPVEIYCRGPETPLV